MSERDKKKSAEVEHEPASDASADANAESATDSRDDGSPPGADATGDVDVDALVAERDAYLDQFKRERASFLNHKKWVEKERRNWEAAAIADFIEGLLPFVDDLDRAREAARTATEVDALREGFEMTCQRFGEALARGGAEEIDAEGQPFDPTIHEAVMQMESPDQPAGTVLQIAQRGYRIGERLVRPAKVIVSKAPADGAQ